MTEKELKAFDDYDYSFLDEPVLVTEQKWPDDVPPLVSVSCKTYMHENFIRDAIEGFVMQKTTFRVEVLIHDDASTDKTADIVREYEKKHPQLIKTTYQIENQYKKKPKTDKHVKPHPRRGKYVALCEGDDYWTDPLKLQKQVEFLEGNEDYVLTYHNWVELVDGDVRPPKKLFSSTHTLLFRNIDIQHHSLPKVLNGDTVLKFMLSAYGKFGYVENILPAVKRRDSMGIWNSLTETEKVEAKINTFQQMLLCFKNTEYHKNLGKIKTKLINNLYHRDSCIRKKTNQNTVVFWFSFIKMLSQKGLLFHYFHLRVKNLATKAKRIIIAK